MYGVIDDPRHTRMTLTDRPWRLRAVAKSRSLSTKIHSSKRVASLSAQSSKQHTVSSATAYCQHTAVMRPHSRTLASLDRDRHADGADRSSGAEAARRSPGSDDRKQATVSSVTACIQHTAVTRPHSRTLASLERDRHADGADRSSSEAARRSPGSDARRSAPVVASASPQTRHPTTARDGTATRTPNRSRSCPAAEARSTMATHPSQRIRWIGRQTQNRR